MSCYDPTYKRIQFKKYYEHSEYTMSEVSYLEQIHFTGSLTK
jgi:hypothetical protein